MSKTRGPQIERIVSGGQTGVDRAALDAAIELGIPHGGWCPQGRRAEDGRIPDRYELRETSSPEYQVRTEQNVIDSDATLILYRGNLSGGTELTARLAREHNRDCLLVNLNEPPDRESVLAWFEESRPGTLNVAGPRESNEPGIGRASYEYLVELFRGE